MSCTIFRSVGEDSRLIQTGVPPEPVFLEFYCHPSSFSRNPGKSFTHRKGVKEILPLSEVRRKIYGDKRSTFLGSLSWTRVLTDGNHRVESEVHRNGNDLTWRLGWDVPMTGSVPHKRKLMTTGTKTILLFK